MNQQLEQLKTELREFIGNQRKRSTTRRSSRQNPLKLW